MCEFLEKRGYPDYPSSVFQAGHHRAQQIDRQQEPITRSQQLPHISVIAFSQTDLFLV